MKLIHKLEPLWWILFGAGGFTACFFLPALLLGVLILAPTGALGDGLAYERAHALASSFVGKAFLGAVLILILWHCAHHLRHLMLDLLGHSVAAFAAFASYGLALAGTVATVAIVAAL
ncbi:MAG TPA: fumarate reductase subunit FrdD [Myxococcota bacterium]|nr:fumarate reductase subunit FrdD [Myxococcota bacterium]